MFYECTVAVLQAEILQKHEQKEHQVELFKLKKKKKKYRNNTRIPMNKIYYNAGIF